MVNCYTVFTHQIDPPVARGFRWEGRLPPVLQIFLHVHNFVHEDTRFPVHILSIVFPSSETWRQTQLKYNWI